MTGASIWEAGAVALLSQQSIRFGFTFYTNYGVSLIMPEGPECTELQTSQ